MALKNKNRVGSREKGVGEEGADQQEGEANLECICFFYLRLYFTCICLCKKTFLG